MEKLEFTKSWRNPADFPTYEPDEAKVREDMQALHDETRDFINNTVVEGFNQAQGATKQPDAAAGIGAKDLAGEPSTVQDELNKLNNLSGAEATAAQLDETVAKSHMHENKGILDGYQLTDEQLQETYRQRHIHNNKSVLDLILGLSQTVGSSPDRVPSEAAVARLFAQIGGGTGGNVPPGGLPGDQLVKQSGEDFDANWDSVQRQLILGYAATALSTDDGKGLTTDDGVQIDAVRLLLAGRTSGSSSMTGPRTPTI